VKIANFNQPGEPSLATSQFGEEFDSVGFVTLSLTLSSHLPTAGNAQDNQNNLAFAQPLDAEGREKHVGKSQQ